MGGHEEDTRESGTGDMENETQDEDPKHYELVIDNDSGTYRPRKELLPTLEEFLASDENFGGLGKVLTVDGFDGALEKWKEERKEAKRMARGKGEKDGSPKMVQVRRGSSLSSTESSGGGRWCS